MRCGKRILWNTEFSTNLDNVTCKSCREAYLYENGRIREYRLGGKFDSSQNERKFSHGSDYKRAYVELVDNVKGGKEFTLEGKTYQCKLLEIKE